MGSVREVTEAAAVVDAPTPARIFLNRFLFRSMLFSMGLTAVVLYRCLSDKRVAWRFARTQARNLTRLCGIDVSVRGLEQLGAGPYMFVSNHQSHLDIALLLAHLPPETRFGAKKELFAEPVLGTVLRTLGMIPIDRDEPAAAIAELNRAAASATSVVMFPEGTRSRDGRLLPFKKGAFVAAIQLGLPVVPVVCKGTSELMPKGKYLSILPGKIELVVLPPLPTTGLTYEQREALRDQVRERIRIELGSSIGGDASPLSGRSTDASGQNG